MIEQSSRRGPLESGRSQLATELLLTAYAVVASVIVLRSLLVMLAITDRVWLGAFIYGLLNPVTNVLDRLPGANREIAFHLMLGDLTLLAPVILFPLALIATSGRYR